MDVYQSKGYRTSRTAYLIQCAAEYIVTLLVSDAFLAKLLKYFGFSDAMTGVISSLISLAFLMQLFSIPIVRVLKNAKTFVVLTDMASVLLYISAYAVPFLPVSDGVRRALVFVCIGGGAFGRYLSFNVYFGWANSFVEQGKRGRFSAVKETVSLAVGIVMSLGMGVVYDALEGSGRLTSAFLVTALFMLAVSAVNLFLLLKIRKRSREEEEKQRMPFSEVARLTLRSAPYRRILLLQCLIRFATYLTIGFLGTYKTGELGFSVSQAQLLVTCGLVAQMIASIPLGIFSDRHSCSAGYVLGSGLALAGFTVLAFTTPKTGLLMALYTALYSASQAGISANASNMLYSYVPRECFPQAQAITSSVSGLAGFGASLLGGRILSFVQENGFLLFGAELYGQQLLAILSALTVLAAMLYALFRVLPKDGTEKK